MAKPNFDKNMLKQNLSIVPNDGDGDTVIDPASFEEPSNEDAKNPVGRPRQERNANEKLVNVPYQITASERQKLKSWCTDQGMTVKEAITQGLELLKAKHGQ